MLRALFVLAIVTACSPSASGAREGARAPTPATKARPSVAAAPAPETHGSRLAPPFGRSAGVRRVTETAEVAVPAAPAVLAAAERDQ